MKARWKVWNRAASPGSQMAEPKVDGYDLDAVVWVVPNSSGVRECRTVHVVLERDGSVKVTHSVTVCPEDDDTGAIHPETATTVYLPGWSETYDWDDPVED